VDCDLSDTPETTSGEEGTVSVSDNCVLESVVEVYGIAPSAFNSVPPDLLSVEGLEHDGFDVVVTPEAESSPSASLGGNASWDAEDRGQLDSQGGKIGEPSVSGFARDRQRDPERGSSVLATQRSEKPETPDPDLVLRSTERAPSTSSAPRLRADSSRAACVATALTALSLATCIGRPTPLAGTLREVARKRTWPVEPVRRHPHSARLCSGQRINIASP